MLAKSLRWRNTWSVLFRLPKSSLGTQQQQQPSKKSPLNSPTPPPTVSVAASSGPAVGTTPSTSQSSSTSSSSSSKKREQRLQKKLEEEKVIQSLQNLDSVVDQDDLTKEKLQELINIRKEQLKTIAQESEIPQEAKITSALIAAPLFLGSIALNYFCFQGMYLDMMPTYVTALVKYAAIQVCFMSGIHWGFAMSMHDSQLDSVNSTPEVRTHFALATLPIFAALGTLATVCYGTALMPVMAKLASVGILGGLQIYNLGLDKKIVDAGNAPKWFWKLKLNIFISVALGLVGLGNLYLSFNKLTEQTEKDPYRKYIPTREELLQQDLKLKATAPADNAQSVSSAADYASKNNLSAFLNNAKNAVSAAMPGSNNNNQK